MSNYRSSARQGKASLAGTLDTLARHRHLLVESRKVWVERGVPLPDLYRQELLKVGIDPDTGEPIPGWSEHHD